MSYKDLTFLLFAKDMSASRGFEKVAASADGMASGVSGALATAGIAVAGLAISVGAESLKLAGNFENATTRLVTDAGFTQSSLGQIRSGILNISNATGLSAQSLATAMYWVGSANIHGADALKVLNAAAETSVTTGTDVSLMANALTTAMKDYHEGASNAVGVSNALVAVVSHGKLTMGDLASSLHSVAPLAARSGITLAQLGGAIATMTEQGVSADQATQNLNHAIITLQAPSAVARDAMNAVGVSSLDVSKNLGKRGLTGTFKLLEEAVAKHTKGGMVQLRLFNSSAQATAAYTQELKALPASLQPIAQEYLKGDVTSKTWLKTLHTYPATIANLGREFMTSANKANGFSTALRSNEGTSRTFAAQMDKMLGGTDAMQVALHLTGKNLGDFKSNVNAVGDALNHNGKHVENFGLMQKTMNVELARAQTSFTNAGIAIGNAFMPALKDILPDIPRVANALVGMVNGMGVAVTGFNKWVNDTRASVKVLFNDIGTYFTTIPPKMIAIGGQIVQGLWNGIQGDWAGVAQKVAGLAQSIPNLFKSILAIHSPSQVFHDIGANIGAGLNNGLLGSVSQIQGTSNRLANTVMGMFAQKKGGISAGQEDSALTVISSGTKQLEVLSKQRAAVALQIKAQQKDLTKELAAQTKAQNTSLKQDTMTQSDVTKWGSAGDMVSGLSGLLQKVGLFKSDLQKLAKMGLDPTTFGQIAAAGVSGGGFEAAESLVQNPIDVKEIAAMQKQLQASASSLANFAGAYTYNGQISATKAKIASLTRTENTDTAKMHNVAARTVNKAAGDVHIHLHVSGTTVHNDVELVKHLHKAVQHASKAGVVPKNKFGLV